MIFILKPSVAWNNLKIQMSQSQDQILHAHTVDNHGVISLAGLGCSLEQNLGLGVSVDILLRSWSTLESLVASAH